MSQDQVNTRIGTIMLGIVAIAVVVGGIVLGLDGKELSSALVAIGSGAAGALAALIVPSRGS